MKILYLTLLSAIALFAKEPVEGHVKDAIITFKKEGESLYIQNLNSLSFKNGIKAQQCVAIKEKNELQITCLSDKGQTVFFTLKKVLFQESGDALVTSPFFKAMVIDPSEVLKIR